MKSSSSFHSLPLRLNLNSGPLAALSISSGVVSLLPTVETLQYIALVVSILAGLLSIWKSIRRRV